MTPNRNCCCGRTPASAARNSINNSVPMTKTVINERSSGRNAGCFSCDSDNFPIGMAYVPWQKFRQIYEPAKGLCRGTIFAELDKPFCGRRGNR